MASCYAPHPVPGAPCATGDACPSGLVCNPASWTCDLAAGGDSGSEPYDSTRISDAPADALLACLAGETRLTGVCAPSIASDPDLVAYWPLDDVQGSTMFRDLSANANTGMCTMCPAAGVPGIRGTAAAFSTTTNIDVGSGPSLTMLSTQLTVLGWVMLNSASQYGYILSNNRDCCGAYAGFALWASHYGDAPAFQLQDGTTSYLLAGSSNLSLGEWHFVAGTFDGTTSTLYVDGQSAGTRTAVLASPPSFELELGAMGFEPSLGLDGAVDEVMVFSRALDATEIATLYNYYTVH